MQTLGSWVLSLCAAMARQIPRAAVLPMGQVLGWVWYYLVPIRRRHVRSSIAQRLELGATHSRRIARGVYVHLATSALELMRFGTTQGLALKVEYRGGQNVKNALGQGRGALVLTAHLGNWEALVRYGQDMPAPVHIVSRQMSSAFWQGAWRRLREGGPSIVVAQGSARRLVESLQTGEMVGFVLDQHAPGADGCETVFLGRQAYTSRGLARLAAMTGAPVIPMFTWREGQTHVVQAGEPILVEQGRRSEAQIQAMTQAYVDEVERAVRQHPEQWLWLHRRWKRQPAAPAHH